MLSRPPSFRRICRSASCVWVSMLLCLVSSLSLVVACCVAAALGEAVFQAAREVPLHAALRSLPRSYTAHTLRTGLVARLQKKKKHKSFGAKKNSVSRTVVSRIGRGRLQQH